MQHRELFHEGPGGGGSSGRCFLEAANIRWIECDRLRCRPFDLAHATVLECSQRMVPANADLLRVVIGSILSKEFVVINELKLPALLARSADDNVRGHFDSCKAITDP
jgi:hypothetical protein